jgi:hypothetical protein
MNRTVQVVGGFDRDADETALANLKLQVDGSITKIKAGLTHALLSTSIFDTTFSRLSLLSRLHKEEKLTVDSLERSSP